MTRPFHPAIYADRVPPLSAMGAIMLDIERRRGLTPIWPNDIPPWLILGDWRTFPILAIDGAELHIIAVWSARRGALRRLIKGATGAGLSPVIVAPMGAIMPAILARWRWVRSVRGKGVDRRVEYRPPGAK